MSAPTPQEIRDRLARVEDTLDTARKVLEGNEVMTEAAINAAMLADAKTHVLHADALTLLVEQQEIANRLAEAQVYATLGEHGIARNLVEEISRG